MKKKEWQFPYYYADFFTGLFFVILAIFFIYIGPSQVRGVTLRWVTGFSPLLFPNIVMGIILVNAFFILAGALFEWRRGPAIEGRKMIVRSNEERRLFIVLSSLILYVFGINYLGYLISTPAIILFLMYFLYERRILPMIIMAFLTTLFLMQFARLLGIVLPLGRLLHYFMYSL